jgi:rRNA pseudouridine-1189 N-methylase Emg1 (Nep1/Mra1 family)
LELEQGGFQKLIEYIQPSYVIAFSRGGRPKLLQEVLDCHKEENLMVMVGAFPHKRFSRGLLEFADDVVSIDIESLEAWIVASRIIFSYERVLGLPEKRLNKR